MCPRPTDHLSFECWFTDFPITIDGEANEPAWATAQVIDQFQSPWLGQDAPRADSDQSPTALGPRQYLLFCEMADTDLYADVTAHDGDTYYNDVFELFFKPNER